MDLKADQKVTYIKKNKNRWYRIAFNTKTSASGALGHAMTVPENNNAPKLIKSLQINILQQPHWSGWLHWLALNVPLNVILCHHIHDVLADFYHAAAELLQSCLLRLCRFLRCLQLPSRLRQGFLGTSKHLVIGVRRMAKIGFYIWIPYQNISTVFAMRTMRQTQWIQEVWMCWESLPKEQTLLRAGARSCGEQICDNRLLRPSATWQLC